MKSRLVVLACFLSSLGADLLLPRNTFAIPVFARKYGFECTMCHSNMPRLNDFGQRYRMNGYQLPGLEDREKTVLESPAPVAMRTSAGYTANLFNGDAGSPDETDFRMNGLDLLSAGQLGRNIGYFMVYVPQVAEARGVTGQEGSLEMASIVFSNLGSTYLNIRAGRFEPAYVPFSVKRQLSVSPYEAYDASFPEGLTLSGTQSGVEISGHGPSRFRYAAGVVEGAGTNRSIDSAADVYLRLATVVGAGEGQTAGQRIGVIGYLGRARPAPGLGAGRSPESFSRLGVDASLNLGPANLALQYLLSEDNRALWGHGEDVSYSSGFGELSWMPRVDFVGFARVDYLDAPSFDNRDVLRLTAGGRFYAVDNVALHGEYSYRSEKAVAAGRQDATLSFVTSRIDFAF